MTTESQGPFPLVSVKDVMLGPPMPVRAIFPLDLGCDPALVASSKADEPERVYDVWVPSHTQAVFEPRDFPGIVDWVVGIARQRNLQAIAGCGHSGLLVAGAVSYVLHIPVIAVRKQGEHPKGDSTRVNGIVPHRPFIYGLVDDFVASGETVARVYSEVFQVFPQGRMTDLILYRIHKDSPNERWSAVEDARATVGRAISETFAHSIRIHGYMDW